MDKINIEKLDTSKIVVPVGYKVIIDPELVRKEEVLKEIVELETRLKTITKPTNEELINFALATHPYYEEQRKLEYLKNENI